MLIGNISNNKTNTTKMELTYSFYHAFNKMLEIIFYYIFKIFYDLKFYVTIPIWVCELIIELCILLKKSKLTDNNQFKLFKISSIKAIIYIYFFIELLI